MRTLAFAALTASCGTLVYGYVGYPVLVRVLAVRRAAARSGGVPDAEFAPRVALVVSAHNEAAIIEEKLRNSLRLDYPPDRLELWVSSDGSTDATNHIVRRYAEGDARVQLAAHRRNRGKTSALIDTVGMLDPDVEIVVFSDANALYDAGAVRQLVRHFADDSVGVVAGELVYSGDAAESLFKRYENWIKRSESALGTCLVAEGSIFAARRELVPDLEADQVEDIGIPLAASLQGYRVVFEPRARSYERYTLDLGSQYRRRKRIVIRSLRTVAAFPDILLPWRAGSRSVMFISHRMLRWFSPVTLLVGISAALALAIDAAGVRSVAVGAAFVAAAAAATAGVRRIRTSRPVLLLLSFAVANAAILAGVVSAARGREVRTWAPHR